MLLFPVPALGTSGEPLSSRVEWRVNVSKKLDQLVDGGSIGEIWGVLCELTQAASGCRAFAYAEDRSPR